MTAASRLALTVEHADGRVTRWGPDEPVATEIPGDLTFSTSIPGGFKDLSCSLLRRIDVEYPDQALYDTVRVYGPGNRTAWEGRMQQFPRQHGSGFQITPGAVGWSAHLRDDPSFREIYVDRDFTNWEAMSLQRKLNLLAAFGPSEFSVAADTATGAPSLVTQVGDTWTATTKAICEAWYDAGPGLTVGTLFYTWKKGSSVNNADANWEWRVQLATDDVATTVDSSGTLRAAGPASGSLAATVANRRWALVALLYNAAGGAAGATYPIAWTALAVVGGHGVPLTSTGFAASDVIANIVSRAAPLLNYTTGTGGSIEATTFVIPHLVFRDPVTAEEAILQTNAYHLYDWGVYDNQEFFYRAPDPTRLTWEARLSEGAQIDLEGDTADSVYNGVLVSFTDPTGKRQVIGPPAAYWSGAVARADSTSSALVDTDTDNPLNAHSIPRRWGKLEISFPTDAAGAAQLGTVWLAERRLASRRGSLKLNGTVTHPTEGPVPVWRVRAGDHIRIADHPSDVARRIISTTYTHGDSGLSCDLDNTPAKMDAILERIGVRQVGVF